MPAFPSGTWSHGPHRRTVDERKERFAGVHQRTAHRHSLHDFADKRRAHFHQYLFLWPDAQLLHLGFGETQRPELLACRPMRGFRFLQSRFRGYALGAQPLLRSRVWCESTALATASAIEADQSFATV